MIWLDTFSISSPSILTAEHAGPTFLYKIQAHWDIDAKMYVLDQSSTIATGSNPNAIGKQRQTPRKAAWILHSPWSPCHLLSCRQRDFSELTMLATTLRVAKQWCPPHIAASPNWRTGIAADHKVGSGFMGWDCEGWKHHGFLRPLALIQIFPRIWNGIFMNFIVLVTLTQIGTTKMWTNVKWPDPVLSVWCCARRENSTVALVGVMHKTSPWKQNEGCCALRVSWSPHCQRKQSADFYGLFYGLHYMSSNSGQMGWASHFSSSLCVFTSLQVFPRAVCDFWILYSCILRAA